MKPILYYCNTIYCNPIIDINPLILQKHPTGKILCLCARDRMITRIKALKDSRLVPVGFWEVIDKQVFIKKKLNIDYLNEFDAVIIIGKERIHEVFNDIVNTVENAF